MIWCGGLCNKLALLSAELSTNVYKPCISVNIIECEDRVKISAGLQTTRYILLTDSPTVDLDGQEKSCLGILQFQKPNLRGLQISSENAHYSGCFQ